MKKNTRFNEIKSTKKMKGGFSMVYKDYDEILLLLKSNLDIQIFLEIRNNFTYRKIEAAISASEIAKKLNTSTTKVRTVINKLKNECFIIKINRTSYRLNPFIYLPFRSESELLQKEWNNLMKKPGFKNCKEKADKRLAKTITSEPQ